MEREAREREDTNLPQKPGSYAVNVLDITAEIIRKDIRSGSIIDNGVLCPW
jgi:hypothetical protein